MALIARQSPLTLAGLRGVVATRRVASIDSGANKA